MDRVFSFLLWPKREARGPWKQGRKKRGSITCRTDRANEAIKMFIIWLCWLFWFWKGDRKPEDRTATYGPGIDQSQHAKSVSHIIKCGIDGSESQLVYRMYLNFTHLSAPASLSICKFSLQYPHKTRTKNKAIDHTQHFFWDKKTKFSQPAYKKTIATV